MSRKFVLLNQYCRSVVLVIVIVIVQVGFVASDNGILYSDDYEDNYGNKEVNDRCITKTRAEGVCKLVRDCPAVFQMIKNRDFNYKSCGFQGILQIVCCPVDTTTTTSTTTTTTTTTQAPPITPIVPVRGVDAADHDCVNKETGERGFLKFARYCPELNNEISDTIDEQVCSTANYFLCYDVVCCPIRSSTKLKHKCRFFDDPDYELKMRSNLNIECETPNANGIKAFYSTECQLTDQPKVILTEASKIQPQCCPISSIRKFSAWDSPDYKHVKVYGRNCTSAKNSNAHGTCRPHNQCPASSVIDQDACYIQRETQFVCCEDAAPTGPKPSEMACYNYSQEVYTETYHLVVEPIDFTNRIGFANDRSIIQGIIAKPTEFPHMVALGYNTTMGDIQFSCSGSLISDKYVLTVAQCLHIYDLITTQQIPVIKVRVGITTLNMSLISNDCPEDYDVERLIPHPDFYREKYYNDIGLIQLKRSVRFTTYVRPICLPHTNAIPPEVIALGYGAVSDINPTNDKLVKILLDTYTIDECKMYFVNQIKKLNRGIDARNQLCAGSRTLLLNACPADSGGSIVAPNSQFYETYTLIGLTVYSKMCGFLNNPGVYTLVHPYRDWIESIVWDNSQ